MFAAGVPRSNRQSNQGQLLVESPTPAKPKLLDRLAHALWSRHYSERTEQTYCYWLRRFIFFHHVCLPAEIGEREMLS
jgi:hypothetical protein